MDFKNEHFEYISSFGIHFFHLRYDVRHISYPGTENWTKSLEGWPTLESLLVDGVDPLGG